MDRELIVALHTDARRYCAENAAHHSDRYTVMTREGRGYNFDAKTYSKEARDVFPRYLHLYAMLAAIEGFVPEDFATLDETRARLVDAVEAAEIDNPATRADPISALAIEEETAGLVAHLRSVDEDWLWRVAPLPHRRVMPKAESDAMLATLEHRFGRWSGGVTASPSPPPHETFVASALSDSAECVRRLVLPLATRVYELGEFGDSLELDVEGANFTGSESYWAPRDVSWMINRSHEDTITIAGEPLLTALNARREDWPMTARVG